jgi:hypothetical protein
VVAVRPSRPAECPKADRSYESKKLRGRNTVASVPDATDEAVEALGESGAYVSHNTQHEPGENQRIHRVTNGSARIHD